MKVRKLKHMRAGITAGPTRLKSDEAARLLHVSHECFDRLVRSGELSAIRHALSGGGRWFSTAQLLAYKGRRRIRQREGLTRMMKATERLGLYDAELEGLPRRT